MRSRPKRSHPGRTEPSTTPASDLTGRAASDESFRVTNRLSPVPQKART